MFIAGNTTIEDILRSITFESFYTQFDMHGDVSVAISTNGVFTVVPTPDRYLDTVTHIDRFVIVDADQGPLRQAFSRFISPYYQDEGEIIIGRQRLIFLRPDDFEQERDTLFDSRIETIVISSGQLLEGVYEIGAYYLYVGDPDAIFLDQAALADMMITEREFLRLIEPGNVFSFFNDNTTQSTTILFQKLNRLARTWQILSRSLNLNLEQESSVVVEQEVQRVLHNIDNLLGSTEFQTRLSQEHIQGQVSGLERELILYREQVEQMRLLTPQDFLLQQHQYAIERGIELELRVISLFPERNVYNPDYDLILDEFGIYHNSEDSRGFLLRKANLVYNNMEVILRELDLRSGAEARAAIRRIRRTIAEHRGSIGQKNVEPRMYFAGEILDLITRLPQIMLSDMREDQTVDVSHISAVHISNAIERLNNPVCSSQARRMNNIDILISLVEIEFGTQRITFRELEDFLLRYLWSEAVLREPGADRAIRENRLFETETGLQNVATMTLDQITSIIIEDDFIRVLVMEYFIKRFLSLELGENSTRLANIFNEQRGVGEIRALAQNACRQLHRDRDHINVLAIINEARRVAQTVIWSSDAVNLVGSRSRRGRTRTRINRDRSFEVIEREPHLVERLVRFVRANRRRGI